MLSCRAGQPQGHLGGKGRRCGAGIGSGRFCSEVLWPGAFRAIHFPCSSSWTKQINEVPLVDYLMFQAFSHLTRIFLK